MKNFIKNIILSLLMIVLGSGILRAVELGMNSGEKLDNSHWSNLSGVLNKIDINSSDLKINGKLSVNGKICDTNNNCIGECSEGLVWDSINNNCKAEWNKFGPHGELPNGTVVSNTGRRSVSCGDPAVLDACETSCKSTPEIDAWSCRDDDNGYPQYRGMCICRKGNTKTLSNMDPSYNAGQIVRSAYRTN